MTSRNRVPSDWTPPRALSNPDVQEFKDAAWECEHGRLPCDRSEPCGCFPQETEIKARRDRRVRAARKNRRKDAA